MHANEITAAVTLSVVGTSHQVDGVVSTVHHSLPVGGQKKKDRKREVYATRSTAVITHVERIRFIHSTYHRTRALGSKILSEHL
jgi:hypothetical protein